MGGSKAQNITQQAINLVDALSMDDSLDFYNDWKIVTVYIGGNDLCDVCLGMHVYGS